MEDRRGTYWALEGGPEGKNNLEDPAVDGRIILKWFLKKWNGEAWTGLIWLKVWAGGGSLLM